MNNYTKRQMWNYAQEQFEDYDPNDTARYPQYLPQYTAAQNLYTLYQEIGETPQEAVIHVLKQVVKAQTNHDPANPLSSGLLRRPNLSVPGPDPPTPAIRLVFWFDN